MLMEREEPTHSQRSSDKNAEALYTAVSANDVNTLRHLLSKGLNPDTCYGDEFNKSSKSILHIACGKGYTECVRALLEAGAMPDIHDKWGQIPLQYCICCEFLETARTLLKFVGNQARDIVNNKVGFNSRSCLYAAAEHSSLKAMELLIDYGANVNDVDSGGMTPLMICALMDNWSESLQAMEMLIKAGAELDRRNRKEQTALQMAARVRNVKAVEYLLSVGASVNSADWKGNTALINTVSNLVARRQGYGVISPDVMSIIVMLTQAGAYLDGESLTTNSLAVSASARAAPLVRFFLEQGADPSVCFGEDYVLYSEVDVKTTPLLIAVSNGDIESVRALLYYNCSLTPKISVSISWSGMCTVSACEMALLHGNHSLVYLLLVAGDDSWRNGAMVLDKMWKNCEDSAIDPELYECLQNRLSSPPSLRDMTVFHIRSQLGSHLHKVVPLLPLPSRIKNMVLLTDLLA